MKGKMQMKNISMTNTNRPVMLTIKEASEYVIGLSELYTTAQYDIGRNANAKIVFFDVALQASVLLRRKLQ